MPVATVPPPVVEAAQPTGFAPALDRPYRYRIEQERDEAGATRRYATERTILFRRAEGGYLAEMIITAVDGGLATGPGALFERAFAGLRGQTIRYRLSARGEVVDIEDRDALWQRLVDAVIAAAGDDPTNRATAGRLAAPLAAIPRPQRIAMLGSMLATVLAPDVVRSGASPERRIRQQGVAPHGAGGALTGTERTFVQGDMLVEQRNLTGDVALPGGTTGQRQSELTRTVDPATGLVVTQRETIRLTGRTAMSRATTRIARLP